jgi:hypothetical protein
VNADGRSKVSGQIQLSWIAPGDDGTTGRASSYDIRYSTMESESPAVSEGNFAAADSLAPYCIGGIPTPLLPGSTQYVTLMGLIPDVTYYFAIKAADELPNWSSLSAHGSGIYRVGL